MPPAKKSAAHNPPQKITATDKEDSPMSQTSKPRALFVRGKRSENYIDWFHSLEDEVVGVLSHDLDLTVIEDDFDLNEVCDKHTPDFIVVDCPGGYRPEPLKIGNARARPDIPRIGFMNNQDPQEGSRVLFLRMMEECGIDRFFSMTAASYMRQSPELEGMVFSAPRYFDETVYKDYGLEKDLPVSVFSWGVAPEFYPWRSALMRDVYNYFPTFIYPHPGYSAKTEAYRFPVSGAAYAKYLNRSRFSLADTTRLDYAVFKHLEIPASGSILVSPPTSDVFRYGFSDLENCILGSGVELFEKMAHVASDPELYDKICKSGHDLVHSRYSHRHWHYIRDWYDSTRSLRPGEAVQQQGFFGPFVAVPSQENLPAIACAQPLPDSEYSLTMKAAWQRILAGVEFDEAESALCGMTTWLAHLAEPWMLMGILALLRGQLARAKEFFLRPYQIRVARGKGFTYLDPEEIVWLSFTGVLMCDGGLVQQMRAEGSNIQYLGLRRIEWMYQKQMHPETPMSQDVATRKPGDRITTHWTGQLDINTWISLVNRIMEANK